MASCPGVGDARAGVRLEDGIVLVGKYVVSLYVFTTKMIF